MTEAEDINLTLFRQYAGAALVAELQPTVQRTKHDSLLIWTIQEATWQLRWSYGDAILTVPTTPTRRERIVRIASQQLATRLREVIDEWQAQYTADQQQQHAYAAALDAHSKLRSAMHARLATIPTWTWPADTAITLTRLSWNLPDGLSGSGWTTHPLESPITAWQWSANDWTRVLVPGAQARLHEARISSGIADLAAADPRLVESIFVVIHGVRETPTIDTPAGPLAAAGVGLNAWLVADADGSVRMLHTTQPVAWLRNTIEGGSND